ncbi:gamma-glutamyl-hercynylcysteine sulfoxide hydrolase [Paractinoplanes deccanensis]|uniref:Gamma-glutamyl-hercynylcysteine sulfoxide hydrolase n=1 Tax=Paractinoplanes deccanensis TaxID=113561 RepID=A0ABQ3YHI3_9ACTN|nr:ergothioneine biosynthesis protein EgtC [Actinoplanes deccanensis]GID79475.1 gamma-glutamyl-hercynylcysteine sulfoxide hydrolase [Actinoplanes deccanensis]
MCRHLAYAGPAIPLARLLFDPPHSLSRQSWAPRDMRGGGTINADGFGVGWFTPAGAVRYRRATPLWSDTTLPALAAALPVTGVLAAVRSATEGMPVVETAAAPFGDTAGPVPHHGGDLTAAAGPWLFSHNGKVTGWPDSMVKLAAGLPTADLLTLEAPTDSALLWALVRARLRSSPPAAAVAAVVAEVEAAAPGSRLNLLLTDGTTIVATTAGHSLSVRQGDGCVLVSSEPLDDAPAWRPVPDRSLLVADAGELAITPLGEA